MRKLRISVFVFVVLAVIAVPMAFSKGQSESASSAKGYFIGLSTKTVTNPWEAYFQDAFEWYSADMGYKWLAEGANGDPAVQLTQSEEMINRGINGLIVAAQDANAAIPIVQYATEHKVPVFTADADINSPDVKMYVGFSGERAGRLLGKKILDYLNNKYGSPKGTVLDMEGRSEAPRLSRGTRGSSTSSASIPTSRSSRPRDSSRSSPASRRPRTSFAPIPTSTPSTEQMARWLMARSKR